jgi:hypothetical protein
MGGRGRKRILTEMEQGIFFSYKIAIKAKPKNEICPYDILKHNFFEIMPGFD